MKNVLSLFDGISCGHVALDRRGIEVGKYYASEIDKHATQVSKKHYPDIIRLGDVENWKEWDIDWASIDILFAGFPCQAWSIAGKQKGVDDPRGKLALVLCDIFKHLKEVNPNLIFLFENVSMKKEYVSFLNELFGREPTAINSNLVTAQNRKRLYWTGQDVEQPEDKGILLRDIVHENVGDDIDLTRYIVPFDKTLQILDREVERGKVGYFRKDSQANRVYYIHNKAVTLCGEAGGGAAKMRQYLFGHTKRNSQGDRVYTENENGCTLNASSGGTAGKGNLLFGCITPGRVNKRQNGQRFNDGKKSYTLTAQDKHGVLVEGYIRKLTPVECERLQTLPDGYTEGISNSQRYKCLGNGWTVDVIAHILKEIM